MSALEQALADYLRLRHSPGHELAEAGWLLPGFVAYLGAHGSPTVTIEAALAWAQQVPKSPAGRVTIVGPRRMTAARGFARYLSGIDAGTEGAAAGPDCRTASWWRRIKISAVFHASRRDSRSHAASRLIRKNTNRRHIIGDHHGRSAGQATPLVRVADGILGTQRQPRQDDQKTDVAASTPTCSANASCSPTDPITTIEPGPPQPDH